MDKASPMIRYTSAPTEYDCAIFGTLCTVFLNDDGSEKELYIQTSRDETTPLWLSAKEVLLSLFKEKLKDESFVKELLQARSIDKWVEWWQSANPAELNYHDLSAGGPAQEEEPKE